MQNNTSNPILEVKHLKKYFPIAQGFFGKKEGFVRAVDDVSLILSKGESLGLVGESGSGKTTLGRIMLKLLNPDSGQIFFENQDITSYSAKKMRPIRQKIQMVFQDPFNSLDPRFNIGRIVAEPLSVQKNLSKKAIEEQVEKVLVFVNLTKDIVDYFPHEFSGGERQRIAIARALIVNPSLLILDEAVSSLDVLVQEQIMRLLIGLRERLKLTYLFISHNLRVVKKMTTTIAVMYQGRVIESAPTAELLQNPVHPYTKNLLSAALNYKAVSE